MFSVGPSLSIYRDSRWLRCKGSNIYERQTHPLVREVVPQKQDRNCQTLIQIWSWAPDGARHKDLIDWLTVNCNVTLNFELSENPCGGMVEYLHGSPASLRRRRKGKSRLWDSKTWSRVFHGTRTREWMRWRGPAAIVNDKPVLSSERAPQINKPVTVWQ
jgi:hypothetical protein